MTSASNGAPLLEVRGLQTFFFTKQGVGRAVDDVSFALRPGEIVGLLGESGSGKTVTCLTILGMHPKPAARVVGGEVLYRNENLVRKSAREMRTYRGREISMILQDPMTALNPSYSIGFQLLETLKLHTQLRGRAARLRAVELLAMLRIPAAGERLASYPHQLSGGTRQRVMTAIALAAEPSLLIADEPTTSLDITVSAAFLDLLYGIVRAKRLAVLFVTHDFSVVARICDRVLVMYAGKIVETADTETLFSAPAHPYTQALVASIPRLDGGRMQAIEGQSPSIFNLPRGCPFEPRCNRADSRCREAFPPARALDSGHSVFCWKYE